MKTYRIDTKSYRFFHGRVQLSDKQARVRAHQLKPLGEGIFEIVQPIEFKAGEILGFDGEVNAALLQNITPIPQIKAEEQKPSEAPKAPAKEKKSQQK